jgi:hypothetical protein
VPNDADEAFYTRADAHIHLSNKQMQQAKRGAVSASMMYGTARFNAWISACGFENGRQMQEAKSETVKYFVSEYEKMLVENLNDYIDNFDSYLGPSQ